jgi:hypothetical protein
MPKYHHKDEARIQHLKLLMLAEQAMFLVSKNCEIALKREDMTKEEHILTAVGISTLYCSPFTENQGLGRINEHFERFENAKFRDIHQTLWDYRNKFAAHKDMTFTEAQVHVGDVSAHFFTPQIIITEGGRVFRQVPFFFFEKDQYELIKQLSDFQLTRLTDKASKVFQYIAKSDSGKEPGTYLLGETYP